MKNLEEVRGELFRLFAIGMKDLIECQKEFDNFKVCGNNFIKYTELEKEVSRIKGELGMITHFYSFTFDISWRDAFKELKNYYESEKDDD